MEDNNWFPDLIVGRLSVESVVEAMTVVAKTIAYERTPSLAEYPDWFHRFLLVAGDYGSDTPTTNASFCGSPDRIEC